MSVLVTGGAGFIGSNFILDWLEHYDELLINLDILSYAGNLENLRAIEGHPHYRFVHGDISHQEVVGALLKQHQVRAVIHIAAESHVDRSIAGPSAFIQTNIVGTFNLLEAVRTYWESLPLASRSSFRFLHVSTDEVYGSLAPQDKPFTEAHPYRPNSPYAASKAASDHLVRAWGHTYGLPVIATNCSNNYGPYQFPEKLIPLCIHHALAGRSLPIYGDGRQVRDWLYVRDHTTALRQALDLGVPGEVYNIGGRSEQANIDVVRTLCQILDRLRPRLGGQSYQELITYVKDRPGHDRRYAIDAKRAEQILNWQPVETFITGLEKTVQWYLNHPQWVASVVSGEYRHWIAKQYPN